MLIHNLEKTSDSADLLRVSSVTSEEQNLYNKNMLKGVTTATTIGKTDGDKTNLVLKEGAFHPTSGGTIGANKAYLQVPTTALAAREMLTLSFEDETTGIRESNLPPGGSQPPVWRGASGGNAGTDTCFTPSPVSTLR